MHLIETVSVPFGPLLGPLTRDELRRACRANGFDDSARSRTELADTLLCAFEGDSGDHCRRLDRYALKAQATTHIISGKVALARKRGAIT